MKNGLGRLFLAAATAIALPFTAAQAQEDTYYWISHGSPADPVWTYFLAGAEQWANDTGGYIAGRTLGKTKLFEKVSPKKTWEGTIGGAVLALGTIYVCSLDFDSLNTWQWFGLALNVVIFGSFGDLVESLFKRTFAIKDSGSSIPGHGGFLDRFDGLILALPFVTAYIMLIS